MTPNEWKERCAARYKEKAGLDDDQAKELHGRECLYSQA
jgi:hypothetical protein